MPVATEAVLFLHVSQSLAITQGVIYGNSITVKVRNLGYVQNFFYSAIDNSVVFMIAKRSSSMKKDTIVQLPGLYYYHLHS